MIVTRRLVLAGSTATLLATTAWARPNQVTQCGIVYYADDPDKKVFRIVYPTDDDAELDGPALETDPATDTLRIMRDKEGQPYQWHTFCVDPNRKTIFEKVPLDDPRARLTGTS
jgi:hypothetical protein